MNCYDLTGGSGSSYATYDNVDDLLGGAPPFFRIDGGTSAPGYFTSTNKHYLYLDANGGTGGAAPIEIVNGSVTVPASPFTPPYEYAFTRWSTTSDGAGGTTYEYNDTLNSNVDVTLFAQYVPTFESFDVTFVSGEVGSGNMDALSIREGRSAPAPAPAFQGTSDYTFIAWTANSDGTGALYRQGDMIEPQGDMTLYAVWAHGTSYAVLTSGGSLELVRSTSYQPGDSYLVDIDGERHEGNIMQADLDSAAGAPWSSEAANITSVTLPATQKVFPTSTAHWFAAATALESADLSGLDTALLTSDMTGMFDGATALVDVKTSDRFSWQGRGITDPEMHAYLPVPADEKYNGKWNLNAGTAQASGSSGSQSQTQDAPQQPGASILAGQMLPAEPAIADDEPAGAGDTEPASGTGSAQSSYTPQEVTEQNLHGHFTAALTNPNTNHTVTLQAIDAVEQALSATQLYDVYQLFTGQVTEDNEIYDIALSQQLDATALQAFLASNDNGTSTIGASAPYVPTATPDVNAMAAYIAAEIESSGNAGMADVPASGGHKVVAADSFAYELAKWLRDDSGAEPVNAEPIEIGQGFTGDQGYYLLVAHVPASGNSAVGFAPIWYPVGSPDAITEKAALPGFSFGASAGGASPASYVDVRHGEAISYQATVTLPGNYKAFDGYALTLRAEMPAADVLVSSSTPRVNGSAVESGSAATVTMGTTGDGGVTRYVEFAIGDVMEFLPQATMGTTLTFSFEGSLNTVLGGDGNPVTATLSFSNDPMAPASRGTMGATATAYTYGLTVNCMDADRESRGVDGARFRLMTSDGKYVLVADGSASGLSDTEPEGGFLVADGGTFTLRGLASGTYTLTQVSSASGYRGIEPVTFTVSPTYGQSGELTALAVTNVTGGDLHGKPGVNMVASATADRGTGIVTLDVRNEQRLALPLTGTDAALLMMAVAAAALAMLLVVGARRRRRSGERAEYVYEDDMGYGYEHDEAEDDDVR